MTASKDKVEREKSDKDDWARFERAAAAAVKSGPKHRERPKDERKERPASKGRVHKGKSRT